MNPFQLQFELARQWMDLTTTAMSAAGEAFQKFGQQTAQAAGAMGQPANAGLPALPWMVNPWQGLQFPMAMPMPMPLAGAGMAGMPFGFANPWSFGPWSAWLGAFAPPTPAQQMATAWMAPWTAAATFAAPMVEAFFGRPAGHALMDQVASNYRSASGFAAAAIIKPFDPGSYGGAWWPMGGTRVH